MNGSNHKGRCAFGGPMCLIVLLASTALHAEQVNRYRPMAESMMEMMDAFSSALQKKGQDYGGQTGQSTIPWGGGNFPYPGMGGSTPWDMNGMPMAPTMSPWSMYGLPMGTPFSPWNMGSVPMPQSNSPWNMRSLPNPRGIAPWGGQGNPRSSTPFNWWPSPRTPLEGRWRDPQGHLLIVTGDRFAIIRSVNQRTTGHIRIEDEKTLFMLPNGDQQGRRYEYAVQDGKLALRDAQGSLLLFKQVEQ